VREQRGMIRIVVSRFTFDGLRGALLCALLVGCAIPVVPYRSVYEDPVNYVRLERDEAVLPEWPPSAHAHPQAMRAEDVSRILGRISVKDHRIWLQKNWRCCLGKLRKPSL
jgi:hypothetical protein